MHDLKMMFKLLKASTKSQIMYKADFLIGLLGTLAYNTLFLASVGMITTNFGSMGGFDAYQIVLLYAIFEISHGLYGFFLQNMSSFLKKVVRDGILDIYITRPCSVLLQLNSKKMNYTAFVDLFIGVVCFIAVAKASIIWSAIKIIMLPIFFISGMLIEFALALIMNCGTVIYPNLRSFYSAYHQLLLITQRYPLHMFAKIFRSILTFVVPLGFVNYYPMLFLIGHETGKVAYFTPIMAIVFSVLAVAAFGKTLKYYSSTGN